MALVLADRVLETCTSPGTGAVTLLGATTGYQTFSAGIGNGNTCYYCIADQGGANWEVGIGTYNSVGNTLTRTTPISGSAATPVNFSSGTQNVFVTYPAEKSVNLDASGNVSTLGTVSSGTWQGTPISDTYLSTISTAGKVSNSATTATNANTASAIVARDASGNFSAGTITASLSGNASTATTANSVANAVTFSNSGSGAASGTTFDGSAARTISYNTIGATTIGGSMFTLTNPSAITFPRFNADNTVSALNAADFRTAIGAGTGSGTVTSVTGTSPVASSGGATPAISLSSDYGDTQNPYASKTANYFLAAPNGTAGVPTFRAVVAADIPTLNQNTTGTAAGLSSTLAISSGGTGATSAAAALTNLGAYPSSNPSGYTSNTGTVTNVTGTAPVSVATGTTTPVISMAAASSTTNGYLTSTDWTTFNNKGSGTVTSVGGTGSVNGITLSGTVTSSGNLTLGGTLSGVSLTTQVSGTLPIANGGTNATTAATALTNLGALALAGGNLTGGLKEAQIAMGANNIDISAGNYFTKTITTATALTVSNVPASGTAATFILNLTNGGSASITWWTGMKWVGGTAPTLTSSGRDVLGFFTYDGGTTWTGLVLGKDVK